MSRRVKDLHALPRVADGWSYLYVERCRIDQQHHGIVLHDERGEVAVPCAMLGVLLVGPGTSITHAAIATLAANGCSVQWVGEECVRFYAGGTGETRSARNLIHQARCHSSATLRMEVAVRMYRMRFADAPPPDGADLQQLRGMEGGRVRAAYLAASRMWGVEWNGRSYQRNRWSADPVNRALSVASSCVYGIAHSAIVAGGYSPGLGFIHTGKALSFVFDVADLYRTEVTIPAAFAAVAEGTADLETRVRQMCREAFRATRLLGRIVSDIAEVLAVDQAGNADWDGEDDAAPALLWDTDGEVPGGVNHEPSA